MAETLRPATKDEIEIAAAFILSAANEIEMQAQALQLVANAGRRRVVSMLSLARRAVEAARVEP